MERQPNYEPAFKSMGKCTKCYEPKLEVCGNANDTQKIKYKGVIENGDLNFKPQLEQGRVEECLIFQSTKK